MKYKVTNTGTAGKAYYNDRGQQIYVDPGETVVRKSRPANNQGWIVEQMDDGKPSVTNDEDESQGGDNE